MFRDIYEPSVWVTATALQVLSDATMVRDFENYFFVDPELLTNMTRWLAMQQINVTSATVELRGAYAETSSFIYDPKFQVSFSLAISSLSS